MLQSQMMGNGKKIFFVISILVVSSFIYSMHDLTLEKSEEISREKYPFAFALAITLQDPRINQVSTTYVLHQSIDASKNLIKTLGEVFLEHFDPQDIPAVQDASDQLRELFMQAMPEAFESTDDTVSLSGEDAGQLLDFLKKQKEIFDEAEHLLAKAPTPSNVDSLWNDAFVEVENSKGIKGTMSRYELAKRCKRRHKVTTRLWGEICWYEGKLKFPEFGQRSPASKDDIERLKKKFLYRKAKDKKLMNLLGIEYQDYGSNDCMLPKFLAENK